MMPTVTIISSIFGNLSVVKECVDSWLPIPPDWEIILYNNNISRVDGTTEYIRQKAKDFNIKLIEGATLPHPEAVDILLSNAKSDWILHFDSDTKILDKKFYEWVNTAVKQRYAVWGRVRGGNVGNSWSFTAPPRRISSKLKKAGSGEENQLYLIRAHPWLILFKKSFLNEKEIDFGTFHITGKYDWGGVPKHFDGPGNVNANSTITIFGDTAWQLYWESFPLNLFGTIPFEACSYCEHKNNSSCSWLRANRELINKEYPDGFWRK